MEKTNILQTLVRQTLISLAVAAAVGLASLLCTAGILLQTEDPTRFIKPMGILCLSLSSIACGVASVRANKDELLHYAVSGLLSGAMLLVVTMFLSLLPVAGDLETTEKVLYSAASIVLCVVGAFVGKRRGKRRSHGRSTHIKQRRRKPRR